MYRFLLRPRWLLLHALVLLVVVVMISLGFWQLRRLDEKQDRNAEITARSDEPVVPIDELVDPAAPAEVGADVQFRPVGASGVYSVDDQVLLRGRDLDGQPGFWVYTPLDLGDGTAVAVNRGWIAAAVETDGSDVEFVTPAGPVSVVGLAERGYPDPRPSGDVQVTVAHLDLDWFDEQVQADLYPVAIQIEAQEPPPVDDSPQMLEPPALDEGPHFSYAVQWFLFTAVALIGYPFLLYRIAQQRAGADDEDGTDQGSPAGEADA